MLPWCLDLMYIFYDVHFFINPEQNLHKSIPFCLNNFSRQNFCWFHHWISLFNGWYRSSFVSTLIHIYCPLCLFYSSCLLPILGSYLSVCIRLIIEAKHVYINSNSDNFYLHFLLGFAHSLTPTLMFSFFASPSSPRPRSKTSSSNGFLSSIRIAPTFRSCWWPPNSTWERTPKSCSSWRTKTWLLLRKSRNSFWLEC